MRNELKTHDYWFLGQDFCISMGEDEISVEITPARHHFVAYRGWRLIRETVDDTPVAFHVLSMQELPSDAFERLWVSEIQLATETHQKLTE